MTNTRGIPCSTMPKIVKALEKERDKLYLSVWKAKRAIPKIEAQIKELQGKIARSEPVDPAS